MARNVHREGDSRICGATTITQQNTVRANNRFISIQGDPNTHGAGALRATETVGKVRINSIPVILQNDPASPDSLSTNVVTLKRQAQLSPAGISSIFIVPPIYLSLIHI